MIETLLTIYSFIIGFVMHSCINQKLAGKYMNVRANTPNNSMKNVQKKPYLHTDIAAALLKNYSS